MAIEYCNVRLNDSNYFRQCFRIPYLCQVIYFLVSTVLSAQIQYQQGWPVSTYGSVTSAINIADVGSCDGNATACEITDVQKAVRKILGLEPCSGCADCEPDAVCGITDVQKMVVCNLGMAVACHD